jgi:hypothetical protein
VPTAPGSVREYRWRTASRSGTARLELAHARSTATGAVLTWSVDTANAFTIERACDDDGAEEPWVALATVAAVQLNDQSWRVPRELDVGVRYAGTVDMSVVTFPLRLDRSHAVVARETIEAADASYDAWRIEIEDRFEASVAPVRSVAWLARDVGLVRLIVGEGDMESTFDLTFSGVAEY